MAKKDEDIKVEETAKKGSKTEAGGSKPKAKKGSKSEAGSSKPKAKKGSKSEAGSSKPKAKKKETEKTKELPASNIEPRTKVVRAKIGFMRQTARKVRRCADLLRSMTAGQAVQQLTFAPYAAALPIKKLIESAMANASNNFAIENPENLKISELLVDDGMVYKRWRAVNKGRAHSIMKRTAQVRLVLSEMNPAEYAAYVWKNSNRNKKKEKVA